jgi:predicted RNA binding protein YcfA (HicA-like mRNA interferase family)
MKNYRILKAMLENAGFELYKDGNHPIYRKDSVTVLVTKNIRNPEIVFKKTIKYYEQSLEKV